MPPIWSIDVPQTRARSMHSPSGQGGSVQQGAQQAWSFATSRTSSGFGMSQRVCHTCSSTIIVPGRSQSWVTLKMMSGVQSHQGCHGHHGQIRKAASSGAAGSLCSSVLRMPSNFVASYDVSGRALGTPSLARMFSKTPMLGWAPVRAAWSASDRGWPCSQVSAGRAGC